MNKEETDEKQHLFIKVAVTIFSFVIKPCWTTSAETYAMCSPKHLPFFLSTQPNYISGLRGVTWDRVSEFWPMKVGKHHVCHFQGWPLPWPSLFSICSVDGQMPKVYWKTFEPFRTLRSGDGRTIDGSHLHAWAISWWKLPKNAIQTGTSALDVCEWTTVTMLRYHDIRFICYRG